MACKDCGPSAAALTSVRTFTFPLGKTGAAELIVRGDVTRDDLDAFLMPGVQFAQSMLRAVCPPVEAGNG